MWAKFRCCSYSTTSSLLTSQPSCSDNFNDTNLQSPGGEKTTRRNDLSCSWTQKKAGHELSLTVPGCPVASQKSVPGYLVPTAAEVSSCRRYLVLCRTRTLNLTTLGQAKGTRCERLVPRRIGSVSTEYCQRAFQTPARLYGEAPSVNFLLHEGAAKENLLPPKIPLHAPRDDICVMALL